MRKLLATLLSLAIAGVATAQTAKQILDKTAKTLEQAGTAQADFMLTAYDGTTEQSSTSGTIEVSGRMFHILTPQMQSWFDGNTQWTMLGSNGQSNEVNIQEPTDDEQARMNPYSFISLYKKGYKLKTKRTELRGKQTHEVTLVAKSADASLQTIIVNIDPDNYNLMCIRLKHDGSWVRIAINKLSLGKTMNNDLFTFPADKYPDVQVIDLR